MGIDLWKCELHSDRLAQQRTLLDSCTVPIITGGSQRVVILPVQFLKQCGAQVKSQLLQATPQPSTSPAYPPCFRLTYIRQQFFDCSLRAKCGWASARLDGIGGTLRLAAPPFFAIWVRA